MATALLEKLEARIFSVAEEYQRRLTCRDQDIRPATSLLHNNYGLRYRPV